MEHEASGENFLGTAAPLVPPLARGCFVSAAVEVTAPAVQKPLLRGVLHTFAAAIAAGAGATLVSFTPGVRESVAVAVFAVSLVSLFTVSATYHRINWSVGGRAWMRRADHASIFVLIAGTYTPIAMLGLPRETGTQLMFAIWGGAVLGVLQSLFWVHAPKFVAAVLALAVGWTLVPYVGDVRRAYGDGVLALILGGGVAYSLGAVAYATRRPALWPKVFGYHEVFHALTLVGATMHFIAVRAIVVAH